MKAFQSIKEYKEILVAFRRQNKKTIKNIYYMFDEVTQLIEKKMLYYDLYDDALIIFRDEGRYWHVSFIIAEDFSTKLHIMEKPCTIGVPDKGSENSEKVQKICQTVEKLGLAFLHCNRMYQIDVPECLTRLDDECREIKLKLEQVGIILMDFKEEYREDILHLWDEYLVCINLNREDCEEGIKDVLIAVDTNVNKVCGVTMPRYHHKNDNIAHIVVEPEYRQYKVSLFLDYMLLRNLYIRGFQKAYTWIADDNIPSLKFHKRYFHIQNVDVRAYQYIL